MKLAYVLPEYPPHSGGGIITYYTNLLPELARMGHDITVVVASPSTDAFDAYESDRINVQFVRPDQLRDMSSQFAQFSAVPVLQKHLATAWSAWRIVGGNNGFDLVEATDWGLLYVPWVVSPSKAPVVVQCHGSIGQIASAEPEPGHELEALLTQLIEQKTLEDADEVQTYSRANAAYWQSVLRRDVTYLPPAWTPPADGGDRGSRGVVVARIQEWKGAIDLCRAMRRLGAAAPSIDWVGRDTRYLSNGESMSHFLSETYGDVWGKTVVPVGRRSFGDAREMQRRAKFAIIPSKWDVFNFTVVEAMSAGTPVIVSDGAGAADLIENGVTGLVVASGDDAALAEAIRTMDGMSDASRSEMGARARASIALRLDAGAIAAQRATRYQAIAHQPREPHHSSPLYTALRPGAAGDGLALLDRLPLRKLARYVSRRAIRKIR